MSSLLMRRMATAPRAVRAFSTTPTRPLAKIILVGRLGATPEVLTTASGKEIVKYSVAHSHGSRENRKTSWFNVVQIDPREGTRDFLASLPKGTLVAVEGEAAMNQYQDDDGNNRTGLNIYQKTFEVLSRPYQGQTEESE